MNGAAVSATLIALLLSILSDSPRGMQAPITTIIPLVGFAGGGSEGATRWFTETRIWNPTTTPATVTVTDIVGAPTPSGKTFLVPARGVLGLRYYDLLPVPPFSQVWAAVEVSSDAPISIMTTINLSSAPCAILTGSADFPAYTGGHCEGIGGPMLSGFSDYVPPGARIGLGWLTTDRLFFRTNLFLNNPGPTPIVVEGTFRSRDGGQTVTKSYAVSPRSLLLVPDVFSEPDLTPIVFANQREQIATAEFRATGHFYVFAATASNTQRADSHNRFTVVQPTWIE